MFTVRTSFYAALVFLFAFCDRVEDPYEHLDDDIDIDDSAGEHQFVDTVYNDTAMMLTRRVMIEDFTGMKCNNCPRATDIGKELVEEYPDRVVFVALHNSSNFSKPDDEFPLDLETETGENLRVRHQMSGFPIGTLNRTDYHNTGTVRISDNNWKNTAVEMIRDEDYIEARFNMEVEAIYNRETRVLRLRPEITCLRSVPGEVRIHAYILEDGIIGPQLDSRQSPALIPDYEFKDVLRYGFPNRESGRVIFNAPDPGDRFEIINPDEDELRATLDNEWDEQKISIVVYLTDSDTREILHSDRFYLYQ